MSKMFIKMLDEAVVNLREEEQEKNPRSYEVVHPSEMFGCARAYLYQTLGYELEPFSPQMLDIFRVGTVMHTELQERMIKLGVSKPEWTEILIEGPWSIEGHADQVLKYRGQLVLVDYKTVGGNDDWWGNKKWKDIIKSPPPEYVFQLQCYMGILRKQGWPINEGYLVFYRKGNSEKRAKRYEFDEWYYEQALDRAQVIWQHIQDRTLPDKEGDSPECDRCKWCRGKKLCWEV